MLQPMYDAGRNASCVSVSIEHRIVPVAAEKVHQPVVDRRRQVEFSQLGQQRGAWSVGQYRTPWKSPKGLNCSKVDNDVK